ncbi:diguanylate cyclase domain-containing protein [Roseibium sp.]|uniref:diguanylate cyclase domain-containing protein n=1 Tax=Roseibium sp. TaxID=1936156 RepID=UPI003A982F56
MTPGNGSSFEVARPRLKLNHWVFLLAALLIGLASASLVFVGHISSREADRQALDNERQLFENALRERHTDIAQEQLTVTQWDRSVSKISRGFDRSFVRDEFLSSLWYDFEIEYNILLAPDNTVLASASRDSVSFSRKTLSDRDPLVVIAERSRQTYFDNRIEIDGGFAQRTVTPSQAHRVGAFSFGLLEGRPVLMSAMAIVPDDGDVTLEGGAPIVLISARFIDAAFLADLNAQLSFPNLRFEQRVPERPHPTDWLVKDSAGSAFGVFKWDGQKPGPRIFRTIVPIVMLLATVLAIAAYLLVRKIGKLSNSLEESEERNRYFAQHDPLTGLANRRHFTDHLAYAIDQLPERPFALLCCDLDRFKAVNDTYGHSAGDMVIRTVAHRLQDAVGNLGIVGRIGGDEFVILITRATANPSLSRLCDIILKSIILPIEIEPGVSTDVGISLGVAVAPEDGASEADLFTAADAALYKAKHGGRNQAVFHAPADENSKTDAA